MGIGENAIHPMLIKTIHGMVLNLGKRQRHEQQSNKH